ncbi:MAG TPA: hypothetical protein VD835_01015 [Pyrinomonadaceae bacterium]|nr:hypothetical protein [Pyrinomonadaceae bacterium]
MSTRPLEPDELQSRLLHDYKIVSLMKSPLMKVTAYRDVDDLYERRDPILSEDQGHLATHYLIEYNIKTLVGRGTYSDQTTVHVDLLADYNYPFTEPCCYIIDSRLPWSPHFLEGAPICLGELWAQSRGTMLLGHLLVHIAKLLNFDEVARGGGYVGWNGEATEYWRQVLGEQPITKNLPYPALPDLNPQPQRGSPAFARRKTNQIPAAGFQIRKPGQAQNPAPTFKARNKPGQA